MAVGDPRARPFHENRVSSMLIMALFGNAVVPLIYGYIADTASLRIAYFWILLPGFAYLMFYAFCGYRIISWSGRKS